MFDAAQLFESQPLPGGRRIGIVSNSAGVATLAADACATRGLEVKEASGSQYLYRFKTVAWCLTWAS